MIRRPPRSTRTDNTLSLHDALPICGDVHRLADVLRPNSEVSAHGARPCPTPAGEARWTRSEEHTSELQSLMRISYAVFCLKNKKHYYNKPTNPQHHQDHPNSEDYLALSSRKISQSQNIQH